MLSLGLGSEDQETHAGVGPGGLSSLGHFRILGRLGAGGMGCVYLARDTELERDVAIKALPDAFAEDPERLARFRREARILASLDHPHIAAIHGLEEADGVVYLVLEFVEGHTLEELIGRGPLSLEVALEIALQMCEALEAAHEKGIVHRDLKPANVILTAKRRVKVLDFGIAKPIPARGLSGDTARLTATGAMVGTTAYMSPEQIRGGEVDERSDIWSLGCVIFEALAGRRAFDRDTPADTISAILSAEPDFDALPPSTTAAVRELLRRALKRDPADRVQTIQEFKAGTERALAAIRTGEDDGFSAIARRLAVSFALGSFVLGAAALFMTATSRSLAGAIGLARLSDGGTVALLLTVVSTSLFGVWTIAGRGVRRIRLASPRVRAALVRLGVVLTAAAVLLVAVYAVGEWRTTRPDPAGADQVDVYVVLPFEKLNDEREQELLDITEHYRATLESVFADLSSVRVMPEVYDAEILRTHSPQCSYRRTVDWLGRSGLTADVVLCGTVDLFDDAEEHSGVMLVSRMSYVRHARLEPAGGLFRQVGSYTEISWLALDTSHRVVRLLEREPGLTLSERDRSRVHRRILERFRVFLSFMDPSGDAAERVEQALAQDTVPDSEMEEILGAYISKVDLEGYAARNDAVRSAFTSLMSGGSP